MFLRNIISSWHKYTKVISITRVVVLYKHFVIAVSIIVCWIGTRNVVNKMLRNKDILWIILLEHCYNRLKGRKRTESVSKYLLLWCNQIKYKKMCVQIKNTYHLLYAEQVFGHLYCVIIKGIFNLAVCIFHVLVHKKLFKYLFQNVLIQ